MKLTDVQVLAGLEAVRKRPHMYVGELALEETLTCVVAQAFCLAADELAAHRASLVTVTLGSSGIIVIQDNGAGLERARTERLVSQLHACRLAKADPAVGDHFCTFGLAVTNALSSYFNVRSVYGGKVWSLAYNKGALMLFEDWVAADEGDRGTSVRFRLDEEFFQDRRVNVELLRARLEAHGLAEKFIFNDRRVA